jgi:two-component system, NtrC family, sensor histidine kinase HydH
VLTRHLSLKLLAPTVLVSLLLVATCLVGSLYLNRVYVNVSQVMRENVQSMQAAANLEAAVAELQGLLRGEHRDGDALARAVAGRNRQLRELLARSEELANLPTEQARVRDVASGLEEYFDRWDRRPSAAADDGELVRLLEQRVLAPCRELRSFNAEQVSASERENVRLVGRLRWALLAVGLGAPLGGLMLGYAVARGLHQSIYQLSVRIRDAAGRLNSELAPVVVEAPADLPALHRQMQGVVEEIERVVGRLQQREREVLRAEQLAAVGQVAAGVAHELRNPLTSVKMLVQTGLEGEPPAGLPAEDLGIIEHEIRRMEACIQTFLDFARPPASERRRCDLLAVVRRALALAEGRARRQGVTLAADLPTDPAELCIDPGQVQQVLLNLLLNALDALPHGGTVRVEVRPPTAAAPSAEVRVADTGLGIAPRIRARLFEPFVSSKETGLGLGLSISRRLVEAHGGTIRGDNAPAGGAVFTFTLPA